MMKNKKGISVMKSKLKTVYLHELRSGFRSVKGWAFIALNILAVGICTAIMNVYNGYSFPEYALESASLALCVTAPLLAAFTASSERKRGETDILLRYCDSKNAVLGRYLAFFTMYLPVVLVASFLPVIISCFGEVGIASAYSGVLGYLLFGAAILALNLYIAYAIPRPIVSLIVGFAVTFSLNMLSNAARIIPASSTAVFVTVAMIFAALITVLMFFYFEKTLPMVIFAVFATALTVLLSLLGVIDTVMRSFMRFLSPQYSLSLFIYGAPELRGGVQLISFALIFTVLSILRVEALRRK